MQSIDLKTLSGLRFIAAVISTENEPRLAGVNASGEIPSVRVAAKNKERVPKGTRSLFV